MLPFGVTILVSVPERLEIPEGLMNYPVFVLHEGNCVICSDEAFCLILITTMTTTNSAMLHNESAIKENNYKYTHLNLHLPCLDICPQVRDING
jgi:hypothetical protein